MRVVRFSSPDGEERVGILEQGEVLDFTRGFFLYCLATDFRPDLSAFGTGDLLESGLFTLDLFTEVRDFMEGHLLTEDLLVEEATLLAPIARPRRIIALGLNYAAHAEESGKKAPKDPIFFVKASTSVIGPEEAVVCPSRVGRIDHEVELAVVIGKGGRRISRRKAVEHIAGYTILNDVTAREMQRRDMAASQPWFLSKSFDTFGPMGPCITLADEIEEPCELELSLRVNEEVRQKGNTRDLIFNVPELIHRLSRHITLEPGDIISTGTPAGIGPIQPGDVMEAEVERIGVLRNPVVSGR